MRDLLRTLGTGAALEVLIFTRRLLGAVDARLSRLSERFEDDLGFFEGVGPEGIEGVLQAQRKKNEEERRHSSDGDLLGAPPYQGSPVALSPTARAMIEEGMTAHQADPEPPPRAPLKGSAAERARRSPSR